MRFLLIISALLLFSCGKHVKKTVSTEKKLEAEHKISIDTGRVESRFNSVVKERYGDTLRAALFFDKTTLSDTIESAGIKVIASYEPVGTGYKVKVVATAKPVENTTQTNINEVEQKARSDYTIKKQESTSVQEDFEKEVTPGIGLKLWWLWIIILLAAAIFIIRKFKLI